MIKQINIANLMMAGIAFTLVGCSDMPWDSATPTPLWLTNQSQGAKIPTYPSTVVYQQAKLSGFSMNDQGNEIIVKPRQKIRVTTTYEYNCPNCKAYSANQIIVGIAGRSAQACIYNGDVRGGGAASFELKAPAMSGEYEVRFQSIQASNCQEALANGWDEGHAPSREATIGKIIVQQKPKREMPVVSSTQDNNYSVIQKATTTVPS